MRIGRQTIARFVIVVLLALSLVGLFSGTASAQTRCNSYGPDVQVCVTVTVTQYVYGTIIHGHAVSNVTLFVRQCDGLGHNCGTIAATHSTSTPPRPVAAGHTYRSGASFTDYRGVGFVNVYSPYIAVPT